MVINIPPQKREMKRKKRERKIFFWEVCGDETGEWRGFLGFAWTDSILQQARAVFLCFFIAFRGWETGCFSCWFSPCFPSGVYT